jgi:hypothetical protein
MQVRVSNSGPALPANIRLRLERLTVAKTLLHYSRNQFYSGGPLEDEILLKFLTHAYFFKSFISTCFQHFFDSSPLLGVLPKCISHKNPLIFLRNNKLSAIGRQNILEPLRLKLLHPPHFWIRFLDWIRLFCTEYKLPF